MKIEIELPDSVFIEAATTALRSALVAPKYEKERGGEAYERVKAAVAEHLSDTQVVEAIRATIRTLAAQIAPAVAREIVTEELRKMVKQVVKEEKAQGSLL